MIWVSILGAAGYTGSVLSKLIAGHPQAQVSTVAEAMSYSPYDLGNAGFQGPAMNGVEDWSMFDAIEKSDLIFNALPVKRSLSIYNEALKQGKKIIDISGEKCGGGFMQDEVCVSSLNGGGSLLYEKVYGLTELNRRKIESAEVVMSPSCYCTGAMLGLAPMISEGLMDTQSVIIDSKSGITSLSKDDKLGEGFVEHNENVKTYKLGNSAYSGEIERQLSKLFGEEVVISYTSYIVPMNRGILTTIYATPSGNVRSKELRDCFESFYEHNPFVRICSNEMMPETKTVSCSNYCDIGLSVDDRTGNITVVTAIDNLMKGAAGQAIQNMNLMYGIDEKAGLSYSGMPW